MNPLLSKVLIFKVNALLFFLGEKKKVPVNYSSIVTDLFDGTIQSSVQCLTCHRVTNIIFK